MVASNVCGALGTMLRIPEPWRDVRWRAILGLSILLPLWVTHIDLLVLTFLPATQGPLFWTSRVDKCRAVPVPGEVYEGKSTTVELSYYTYKACFDVQVEEGSTSRTCSSYSTSESSSRVLSSARDAIITGLVVGGIMILATLIQAARIAAALYDWRKADSFAGKDLETLSHGLLRTTAMVAAASILVLILTTKGDHMTHENDLFDDLDCSLQDRALGFGALLYVALTTCLVLEVILLRALQELGRSNRIIAQPVAHAELTSSSDCVAISLSGVVFARALPVVVPSDTSSSSSSDSSSEGLPSFSRSSEEEADIRPPTMSEEPEEIV